ncbi:MAG: host-nuclease inhibitor Gam family protein [Prevotellaceae bacterium]|jgi:Tfp pilus assembly protein PilP|nr:host-nuclease inhibitor Gam family protein [Prevotellaceae bacterium]
MKTKKLTVPVLLTLSMVIWGVIAWKVYAAMHEESREAPVASPIVKPAKPEAPTLLLNYKDPFLGDYRSASQPTGEEPARKVTPAVRPPAESTPEAVPDFTYKGFIRVGKEVKAMVERNGKSLQLKAGDRIGLFRIEVIGDYQLTVTYQSRKYELPVQ